MIAAILLLVSILLQCGAVYFALRLIPVSRGRTAWVLISAAIVLRAVRHLVQFGLILNGSITVPSTLDELLSTATSLLLVIGLWAVSPLFLAFQEAEKKNRALLEESRALQKAAQEADRAKDEFLTGVSHELRTPLTVLIGALDLAKEPSGAPQPQVLKMAWEAAQALRRLIEDLLDSARIGAGRLQFVNEPYSPQECLEKAVRYFQAAADSKGLRLRWEVSRGLPKYLMGDAERVSQVLRNLLDNAVKFTSQGEVRISLYDNGNSPDGKVRGLLYRVRDTGCGIPEDKLKRVFENFYQVDMSPTRLYRGMGLGLGLSQALVEGMGGRIWVEATGPGGTTISFVLPPRGTPEPSLPPPGESPNTRKIVFPGR